MQYHQVQKLLNKFKNRSTSDYWKQGRDESIRIAYPTFLNMEGKSRKCHSSQAPHEEHVLLLWGSQNTWLAGPVLWTRKQLLMLSCSYLSRSLCCGSINAPIAFSKDQPLPPCSHSFCCNSPSRAGTHGPWIIYLPFCYVDCFLSRSHTFLNWSLSWLSSLELFHCHSSKPVNTLCFSLSSSDSFTFHFFSFIALLLWQWLAWLLLLTPNPPMAE